MGWNYGKTSKGVLPIWSKIEDHHDSRFCPTTL
jgi:hypothetical protein